jgi:hypothetical protein
LLLYREALQEFRQLEGHVFTGSLTDSQVYFSSQRSAVTFGAHAEFLSLLF